MSRKFYIVFALLVVLSLALTGVGMAQEMSMQPAAEEYFGGGVQSIRAADLFDLLNDGDTSNDPLIVDLRAPDDYAAGHIPGAVNMSAKEIFTPAKLAEVVEGAANGVVTYCYTGQTSSQVTSVLNMMEVPAKSMLFGFPSWANVPVVAGQAPFDAAIDQYDYKIDTEAVEATEEYDLPAESTVADYFGAGTKNIKASDVFDNLNDGDTSNDPFMIDVRRAEDYAAGHIPGAVSMDPKTMFSVENLAKIPSDKQVVVNCYTGQSASHVVSALNLLGYDATNLKFGFASWSPTGAYPFDAATASGNYKYEGAGAEMAVAEEAAPAEEEAMAEEAAPVAAEAAPAAPAAEPAQLPATGAVPFDFTWIYLLVGSGLLGSGLYLRRK